MPPYNKKTWASGELADAVGFNQMSDNIAKGLRSVVDDREFAVGVEADLSILNNTNVHIGSALFSAALGGDPSFSGTPIVFATIERSSAGSHPANAVSVEIYNVTTSGFSYTIRSAIAVSGTKYVTMKWLAIKP